MAEDSRGEAIAGFNPAGKRKTQLPAAFDMQCRRCRKGTLEHSNVPVCTTRQPFAVLQCNQCNDYMYLFGAVDDPLIAHSSDLKGSCTFSADIDELFRQRALDRERKMIRSTGLLIPP